MFPFTYIKLLLIIKFPANTIEIEINMAGLLIHLHHYQSYHVATITMMIVKTIRITTMIPIVTFLFFHHILFFTFLEVSRISSDWSANVSLFFTRISIFSPLSITLSIFRSAVSYKSLNSFFKRDSLSTDSLLLYFPIHSCKIGLKSFNEWAIAVFLLFWS